MAVSRSGVLAVGFLIDRYYPNLTEHFFNLFQMPRKWVRTTQKAKWTAEQLEQAIKAVNEGMSIRKASKTYDIPFSTLQERLKSGNVDAPTLGRKCDFPLETLMMKKCCAKMNLTKKFVFIAKNSV